MGENEAPERIWLTPQFADAATVIGGGIYHANLSEKDREGCIEYVRADLAAPDAAQGNENTTRFLEHFITRVEPFYEKKHGKLPPQEGALWELLMFVQHELDAARQARWETWNSVISKLNERAEDWRLQAERWQKQAENETNEAIRDLSFSDRDACLSKMSALKTFAIEAAALRAEGEKGEENG